MEWCLDKFCLTFQTARGTLSPGDIKNRRCFLAVSLKNPLFSNQWITSVLRSIAEHQGQVVVTLVDDPYVLTAAALSSSAEAYRTNMEKLNIQRSEQLRRIDRIIDHSGLDVEFLPWRDISEPTPHNLVSELEEAFYKKEGRVRTLVLRQVANALPQVKNIDEQMRLAEFFLSEAPVLLNYYYAISPGVIDIYPSPQAQFFWELDTGLLTDELPIASSLASDSPPHVYCYSA